MENSIPDNLIQILNRIDNACKNLDLLLNKSLELLNLLGVGLLSSGQLGHQGLLLLHLARKLTCGELRKLFVRSVS